MKRLVIITTLTIAATSIAGWVALAQTSDAPAPGSLVQPAQVDITAGQALYVENCAACHGANLEGQADWQNPGADGRLPAPPHNRMGHTWHHSDSVLFGYTQLGGTELLKQKGVDFDSGMPGFGDTLSDQETWNILAYIKSTWPDRERDVQAERSLAEQQ
jgi:mono/diheme cytochrome c family protein